MRIREKDAKKQQQAGGQEGTYRRKPTPVKRYAGDLLAPVSVPHSTCAVDTQCVFKAVAVLIRAHCSAERQDVFLMCLLIFSSELSAKSAGQTDGHWYFP